MSKYHLKTFSFWLESKVKYKVAVKKFLELPVIYIFQI